MRFQTMPDNLQAGISTVQRAVAPKSPLAILSGILFEFAPGTATLTGSNMDLTISRTIPVTGDCQASVVLPTKQLAEVVRRLSDSPLVLTIDPVTNSTELSYGQGRVRLNGFDPAEYPRPVEPEEPQIEFQAPCDVFQALFRRVLYAVGQDELRPVFTGVLLEIEGDQVRAVATDAHRLALNQVAFPGGAGTEVRVIISGRALSELVRILAQTEEEKFRMALAENHVSFTVGPTKLLSRVINGNYPDYRRVIPTSFQARITGLDAMLLLRTVERAATLAQDTSPVVNFQLENGLLRITAQSDTGAAWEEIPVDFEGEAQEVSFNAKYLEDALRWCETSALVLELNGPVGPAIFRPVSDTDHYLALVLPVRLF